MAECRLDEFARGFAHDLIGFGKRGFASSTEALGVLTREVSVDVAVIVDLTEILTDPRMVDHREVGAPGLRLCAWAVAVHPSQCAPDGYTRAGIELDTAARTERVGSQLDN
jgi:hypothetical protein